MSWVLSASFLGRKFIAKLLLVPQGSGNAGSLQNSEGTGRHINRKCYTCAV